MPKKLEQKRYFIKEKEIITDPDAPVVSNEFVDKQPEGEYRGQTIEVHSDTKLEADTGVGSPYILRTFIFALDPKLKRTGLPPAQAIFESFARGIEAMLWGDGLRVVRELEPKLIFTKNKKHVLIMVWAEPRLGQVLTETPKTLSQIINENRPNKDKV